MLMGLLLSWSAMNDDWMINLSDLTVRQRSTNLTASFVEIYNSPEFQELLTNEIDQEILNKLKEKIKNDAQSA